MWRVGGQDPDDNDTSGEAEGSKRKPRVEFGDPMSLYRSRSTSIDRKVAQLYGNARNPTKLFARGRELARRREQRSKPGIPGQEVSQGPNPFAYRIGDPMGSPKPLPSVRYHGRGGKSAEEEETEEGKATGPTPSVSQGDMDEARWAKRYQSTRIAPSIPGTAAGMNDPEAQERWHSGDPKVAAGKGKKTEKTEGTQKALELLREVTRGPSPTVRRYMAEAFPGESLAKAMRHMNRPLGRMEYLDWLGRQAEKSVKRLEEYLRKA